MMHAYSHSPLSRSTADLHEEITHGKQANSGTLHAPSVCVSVSVGWRTNFWQNMNQMWMQMDLDVCMAWPVDSFTNSF